MTAYEFVVYIDGKRKCSGICSQGFMKHYEKIQELIPSKWGTYIDFIKLKGGIE